MADDATITPAIHEHPAVQRQRLMAKLERTVDRLIATMDLLGGDADEEPSLGFLERNRGLSWPGSYDQRGITEGLPGDVEDEHDGCEPPEDLEESLGRSENIDQRREERGQPDSEPSLGASADVDQRRWGERTGSFTFDAEEQCEDEGEDTDSEPDSDAEPDHDHMCNWQDEGDQTRLECLPIHRETPPDVKSPHQNIGPFLPISVRP